MLKDESASGYASLSAVKPASDIGRWKGVIEGMLAEAGQLRPPVDMDAFAESRGIQRVVDAPMGVDGMLLPIEGEYVVALNENQVHSRRRFSFAHEIGHFLLDSDMPAFRRDDAIVGRGGSVDVEKKCNRIAAELLMPTNWFQGFLLRDGLSLDSITKLSEVFDTSIRATAARAMEVANGQCLVVVSSVKSESGCQTVDWCKGTRNVPKGVRCDSNLMADLRSARMAAYANEAFDGWETLQLGKANGTFHVESRGFGKWPGRYALSMIHLDRQTASLF